MIPKDLRCPYRRPPSPEAIEQFMKRTGWSKDDLAAALGVTYQAVNKWLEGKANMKLAFWELLNIKAKVQINRGLKNGV